MAKAALLFNGIGYSFPLIEQAFNWTKQNNGSLVALFLKAKHETREGYIFPSDLDAAQNSQKNEDAESANLKIIHSNISMLEHRAASEHIDITTKLLNDPSAEQVLEQLSGCEPVFIDDKIDQSGILRVENIDLEKLLKKARVSIVKVQG
jgi:hypothetical protein